MIAFLETRVGRLLQWLAGATLLVSLALAIGRIVPTRPEVGIVAALLVLALGITAAEPAAIPLLSMPLLLVVRRVGGEGIDLSVSDAVLFVATLAALVFTIRPFSRPMRTILWLSALYQFTTLFTVVANPYTANVVEWVHAWMLISGALIMGWTIGRSGYARAGLTMFLAGAFVLASATLVQGAQQYLRGDFSAVYLSWPYGMHKNFVGTVLCFGAVLAYARPSWVGWSRKASLAAFWWLSAGILVTQSRQAILGLGAALLLLSLRGGERRTRSKMIVFAVIPAILLVATMVSDQLESGEKFNSASLRLESAQATLSYWLDSPWLGHGLRFWYVDGTLGYQPPNVGLELLASAGLLGLLGFVTFVTGSSVALWRVNPVFGNVALAILLSRMVQAQFDFFWSAVQVPVPFAIIGVALGALARVAENDRLLNMSPRGVQKNLVAV